MAKKKIENKIHVKNPKIGEDYYFYFAGGWLHGKCVGISQKLTDHYGCNYYKFETFNDYMVKGEVTPRLMRYPIAIYNIKKTLQ